MKKELMLGNEAIARGAFEAGVRVLAAYPGTPSTEIAESAAKYDELLAQWAPNEKVALEVAIGASVAGTRAMACMKHVGLNVAADPLFTAAYAGVNGGLVVVCADDPGMHSSQNEQDTRLVARAAGVPVLEPSDSQEALDYTVRALELSEEYDMPVILRITTRVAHQRSVVETSGERGVFKKSYEKNPQKFVMMPAMARARHIVFENNMKRLTGDADTMRINRIELRDTKLGVICGGAVYQYVKEALPDASVLKLGLTYPLPKALIAEFSQKVDKLYVVEELEPFFESQIKAMGISCEGIASVQGELSVAKIKALILGGEVLPSETEGIPVRPPVLCPGCPHRASYYAIKRLGLRVCGDIGCYTLGALKPLQAIDTCFCMGASIGMAFGMEEAESADKADTAGGIDTAAGKTIAVIGDSTFLHSGIAPLMNAVYNQGSTTVVILDNAITGMTGHQHHPATGKTLKGRDVPAVDLVKICEACNVRRVRVVDPFDLKAMETALREETAADEVSVIIARRPCALLLKDKFPVSGVNMDKCKACRACLSVCCPAIENREGKPYINAALCFGCGLCKRVCKFDAIESAGDAI